MRRKDSTVQCHFHPHLTSFLFSVDELYKEKWETELTITSGSESDARHSKTSLHYAIPCQAADLRTWSVGLVPSPSVQFSRIKEVAIRWAEEEGIPEDWIDVILESDHIHVEFQPKRLAGV